MSRRPLLATALLTLATAAWSADGPLLDLALADGAKLVADWNASIYAKLWNEPAFASQREKVDANLAQMEITHGKQISVEETLAKIDAVTFEEIREIAQEFFQTEQIALAALGNLNGLKIKRERLEVS